MLPSEVGEIDPADVRRVVGSDVYRIGLTYARSFPVASVSWNAREFALEGWVTGPDDEHSTTVYFFSGEVPLRFEQGQCSCRAGFNCVHVVALQVAATAIVQQQPGGRLKPRAASWERSLSTLLDPAREDRFAWPRAISNRPVPLAIELTLAQAARSGYEAAEPVSAYRLLARLMRPGKHGWWINGGLNWSSLGDSYTFADHPPRLVRLLREFYALYRGGRGHSMSYGYSYSEDKTINVSAFESRQLWPLLEEARAIGLRLVHGKKGLGELGGHQTAELCLDVTGGGSRPLVVAPVFRLDGAEAVTDRLAPVCFIGSDCHGLVHVDRADFAEESNIGHWSLRLAKLAKPVPERMQRLLLQGGRLEVPAAEGTRFRDEYCPRLRQLATVISSDGSFTPPEISEPTVVLRASYGNGHELEIGWEWAYQVGETELRAPLDAEPTTDGHRDLDAERALLAGLNLPLEQYGLDTGESDHVLADGRLSGMSTMRFTTELLPLLSEQPGVTVEIDGDPVDYRDVGDALQIGVSAEESAGESDWFDLGITVTIEGQEVPFTTVFAALSQGESHLLLPDGAYFSLDQPELLALRKLIDEAKALQDRPTDPLRLSRFQVGLWEELAQLGVVTSQATAWWEHVQRLQAIDSVEAPHLPATLNAQLRPYQVDGFGWLAFCWQARLGGILADDMGLGKTLQALALICHAKQTDPQLAPFLVLAPTSVVSNWVTEAARFAPDLSVVSITDTAKRRGRSLAETVAGADVVVTSYTLYRLEADDYVDRSWAGLILDEAQNVKNHQAKVYQCVRRLTAPYKVAITGTPMENSLMELWSLLSITAPGLFPNPTRFRDYYARPIEKGDSDLLAQLRRRIRPLVKRRTKELVAADLPTKREQVLEVELHRRHRTIYETHLQRERQKVLGLLDNVDKNRFTILRSLTLLRQLSLHAELVDDKYHGVPCTRLDVLLEQVRDVIDGGHRALVFSQFTGFLALVRQRLDADGIDYAYLDGKTTKRAAVIDGFKTGTASIFLISLKAGGFGLNLTEADYCFLLDPWWNPATEAQAVDRTHRIGQTRNVMVYRFVGKDTIEEKVMALKQRKAELFASVMDDGNAFGGKLDAYDIRELFA